MAGHAALDRGIGVRIPVSQSVACYTAVIHYCIRWALEEVSN